MGVGISLVPTIQALIKGTEKFFTGNKKRQIGKRIRRGRRRRREEEKKEEQTSEEAQEPQKNKMRL